MFTVYVEKRVEFRSKEEKLRRELEAQLDLEIDDLRLVRMYYTENELTEKTILEVFCDRGVEDYTLTYLPPEGYRHVRVEFLSGQFDQQSYLLEKCLQLLGESGPVGAASIYLVKGVDDTQWDAICNYLINPVESREIPLDVFPVRTKRKDADRSLEPISLANTDLQKVLTDKGLALSVEDMEEIRSYFLSEGRDPNWSELKFLETFWSDHCRHTTFHTVLEEIDLSECGIESAKEDLALYERLRKEWGNRPATLMDLAVWSIRRQKKQGNLDDLEESEEINAASVYRKAGGEEILLMFKNETHNHPTEIEPFGGAATCLGGAIRDPLSGRSHVYQSMRLTGARDPRDKNTLEGKLPQLTLCRRAADGFSSYGNQIGLSTGCVQEFYHPGFEAKRMEAGFVIAAAKKNHVTRGNPQAGDLLLLLGGDTGCDGIGGASGSSKSYDEAVVEDAASEVQKGNAPEERKLMRFFREEAIGPKIVRCNDLGAGGIGVAFGEIAPGLSLSLDHVPLKHADIHAWETLLSESQERMALVIRPEDLPLFEETAKRENLTLTKIGRVTEEARFVVTKGEDTLVSLSREFLSSSGAVRTAKAVAEPIDIDAYPYKQVDETRDALRYASLQGLSDMFDSTAGSCNVLGPYGGKHRKTPVEGMVSLIPIGDNQEDISIATWGYDPHLAQWSPYHGAQAAVLLSLLRALALGSDIQGIRFTFQEYFERLGEEPARWAKPLMALLGANSVLETFGLASIGGKDSMSGSYLWEGGEIRVPPSLLSFAVNTAKISDVVSPEWKQAGSYLYLLPMPKKEDYSFDLQKVKEAAEAFLSIRGEGVLSASVVEGSLKETLLRSAFGNCIGAEVTAVSDTYGSILIESEKELSQKDLVSIGRTTDQTDLVLDGERISLDEALKEREATLSEVYKVNSLPLSSDPVFLRTEIEKVEGKKDVNVFVPVFPGTNGEEDVALTFRKAGATITEWVFRDRDMEASLKELAGHMEHCDILALTGGFSAGDEPDAHARFLSAVFRKEPLKEAFHSLLERGGAVIGIGSGFSALVKLGVFYDGMIREPEDVNMSVTLNAAGRHQAMYVDTLAHTDRAPWLVNAKEGMTYRVPVSHAEGRFVATQEDLALLKKRGQIATSYVENPNGSVENVEGLISPCGKIIGRMSHSERLHQGVGGNVSWQEDLQLFASAVAWMKGKK